MRTEETLSIPPVQDHSSPTSRAPHLRLVELSEAFAGRGQEPRAAERSRLDLSVPQSERRWEEATFARINVDLRGMDEAVTTRLLDEVWAGLNGRGRLSLVDGNETFDGRQLFVEFGVTEAERTQPDFLRSYVSGLLEHFHVGTMSLRRARFESAEETSSDQRRRLGIAAIDSNYNTASSL